MRKASIYEVSPGDELAVTIKVHSPHPDTLYKIRLEEGTALTREQINRLREAGQDYVLVKDPYTEDLDEFMHEEELAAVEEDITREINKIETQVKEEKFSRMNTKKLRRTVEELLEALKDSRVMAAFTTLKSHDDYTAKHSLDVCRLSLAFTLRYREEMITRLQDTSGASDLSAEKYLFNDLGMGGILHDIGKWKLPGEVLNKSSDLAPQEWQAIKKHPQMGHELITKFQKENTLRAPVKITALCHHEKFSGEGYPEGLSGRDIHLYGRLAACCDVYSALTSQRPYRVEMTPNRALETMRSMQEEDNHFDPELLDMFLDFLNPFPPGQEIILSDGRRGVVSEITDDKNKPVVRILFRANKRIDSPYEIRANTEDGPEIIN